MMKYSFNSAAICQQCGAKLPAHAKGKLCRQCRAPSDFKPDQRYTKKYSEEKFCDRCGARIAPYNKSGLCRKCYGRKAY